MEESLLEIQLTPVNIDKAEYIISLASKKNGAFKSMMQMLREVEDQIQGRYKKNKIFYQVVKVVDSRYKSKIHHHKQEMENIKSDIDFIEQDVNTLTSQRLELKKELDIHEEELNEIRDYAEQRRNKKSKRERQYHQLYNIPIVATQFKKKYVRARDKNSDAEEKVSEVRTVVEACQRAISEITKSISDSHKKREDLIVTLQQLSTQSKQFEDLLFNLHEGSKFWSGIDKYQSETAMQATISFIETIQKHSKNHNSFHKIMDPNNDFVKIFKLALYEFGQAEQYAESTFGQLQVEFDCAKCKSTIIGWPTPDKVRIHDLLCDTCYKESRTSMIWEKKMKIGMDKSHQLLSLPGGSTLSFSSSTTTATSNSTNSSQTSSNNKPGFKKMLQIFKGAANKRRSSSHNSFVVMDPSDRNSTHLLRT